jgi:hypothetical protein
MPADRRKPGRPRLDPAAPSVAVNLHLPVKQFDVYCRRALARGVSIAEVIRRDLRRLHRHDATDDAHD